MNLVDINTLFPTDEKCRELLTRLRWPAGPECPRCKMPAVELETEKTLYYCKECDYQFTVTAGTIFNDSHLPLTRWFIATLLLCEAKKGMSACQMQRTLGVSYKTAWYLCHRIRAAMKQAETHRTMLDGTVEMDETYIGGRLHGAGKDWRGQQRTNKEVVIGIRKRKGDLRFFHADDAKIGTLQKYIQENISEDMDVIITDELPAYRKALGKLRDRHQKVNHWKKEYVRRGTDIHTNTIESAFSLLKRGIAGSWHKISAKHLCAYLDEMTFRFNRRKNHNLFLDTLRHMITAPILTFEKLTA